MFALVLFVCYLDGGCEDIVVDVYNTEQQAEVLKEKLAAERPAPEETLSFYVAVCLEFTFAGEFHDHLTMEEALEAYDKIPVSYTHLDVYKRQAGKPE